MTRPTIHDLAAEALEFLAARDHRWMDRAWSIYYGWPEGVEPEKREALRDALGKLQMCHTGEFEDPAITACRDVLVSMPS